jgi:hypothetical protein
MTEVHDLGKLVKQVSAFLAASRRIEKIDLKRYGLDGKGDLVDLIRRVGPQSSVLPPRIGRKFVYL